MQSNTSMIRMKRLQRKRRKQSYWEQWPHAMVLQLQYWIFFSVYLSIRFKIKKKQFENFTKILKCAKPFFIVQKLNSLVLEISRNGTCRLAQALIYLIFFYKRKSVQKENRHFRHAKKVNTLFYVLVFDQWLLLLSECRCCRLIVFWLAEIIELGSIHFIIVDIMSRKRVDTKVDQSNHHLNKAKHIFKGSAKKL